MLQQFPDKLSQYAGAIFTRRSLPPSCILQSHFTSTSDADDGVGLPVAEVLGLGNDVGRGDFLLLD